MDMDTTIVVAVSRHQTMVQQHRGTLKLKRSEKTDVEKTIPKKQQRTQFLYDMKEYQIKQEKVKKRISPSPTIFTGRLKRALIIVVKCAQNFWRLPFGNYRALGQLMLINSAPTEKCGDFHLVTIEPSAE